MKKTIICDGDSWVFGCEIVDPEIAKRYDRNVHPGHYDHLEENNNYRIPKIFPTHLSKLMNANLINLSWPGNDNGTILNRIITYITSNYINKKISTEDLFIIVGWSSPERNVFWYKDDNISKRFVLWPYLKHFDCNSQEEFWNFYVNYLWNKEEYLPRFVMNVLLFQNFCDVNKIKWLCFNSFYQSSDMFEKWSDLDLSLELGKLNLDTYRYSDHFNNVQHQCYEYNSLWNTINDIRFYKKNQVNNTFKSFMELNTKNPYNGMHPSPDSHLVWAEELYSYIQKNKLYE